MKAYFILMLIGVQGISIIGGVTALSIINKQQKEIEYLRDSSLDYEGCESDLDYYLRSVELGDNKFVWVSDSIALLAAEHPHTKIAATVECAGAYLHIELD